MLAQVALPHSQGPGRRRGGVRHWGACLMYLCDWLPSICRSKGFCDGSEVRATWGWERPLRKGSLGLLGLRFSEQSCNDDGRGRGPAEMGRIGG